MSTVPLHRRPGVPGRELLLAAVICTVVLAALIVWGLLALVQLRDEVLPADVVLDDVGALLVGLTLATAGLLIVAHRSSPVVGRLMLTTALGMIVGRAAINAVTVHPGNATAVALALLAWITGATLHTVMIGVLPLLFPAGRLPHPRLRWYVAAVAVWGVLQAYLPVAEEAAQFGVATPITPAGLEEPVRELRGLLRLPIDMSAVLLVLIGVAVMLPRWRRAEGPLRRLTVAFVVPSALWAVCLESAYLLRLMGWPRLVLLAGGAALWAGATAYVFTRDRMWAIDRPTRHLLTGFVLITGLLVCYSGAVATVAAAVSGSRTVLLACLAFAAGFVLRPTAHRCALLVDRLYYGERAHPYQLTRSLAERLSRTVRPQDAPTLLCSTIVGDLRLPAARLAVPTRSGPRELAAAGRPGGPEESFDLVYGGAVIGRLHVRPRDGATALDGQDRQVLRSLADQAAPAVASLRLYEDLRAGCGQIVTAREEERRRLRRDIHDGLGPALSALRLRIDTARSVVPDDSPAAAPLEAISGSVARLIDDVRHISDGLVPGALAEVGLGRAVRRLAAHLGGEALRIEVRLRPDPLPGLPAAVEAAAYQITAEAITNVVRHAAARHARITLTADAATVRVEVRDDGGGMPPRRDHRGVGLHSMADRAAELGGEFDFSSGAGGTVVRATLPCTMPPATGDPAP